VSTGAQEAQPEQGKLERVDKLFPTFDVKPPMMPPASIWLSVEEAETNIDAVDRFGKSASYVNRPLFLQTNVAPGDEGYYAAFDFTVEEGEDGKYLLSMAGPPVGRGHASPVSLRLGGRWYSVVSAPLSKAQWGTASATQWSNLGFAAVEPGRHRIVVKVDKKRPMDTQYCMVLDGLLLTKADKVNEAAKRWRKPRPKIAPKPRTLPRIVSFNDSSEIQIIYPRFRTTREIEGESPFGTIITSVMSENNAGDPKKTVSDICRAGYKWLMDYIFPLVIPEGGNPLDEANFEKWKSADPRKVEYLKMITAAGLKVHLRFCAPRIKNRIPKQITPEYCEAFARHSVMMVRQYGKWVKSWELLNEKNGAMAPVDYAKICNVAYKAIKAVDPEAQVWVGATAMLQCLTDFPEPWIQKTLDAGIQADGYSFHPYCQPYVRRNFPERGSQWYPWNYWPDYHHMIADLRSRLDESKLTKGPDGHARYAATEVGWPTHVDRETWKRNISYLTQAKYEQRGMLLDFWLGVRPRFNFIFTRPWHDMYERESHFQLVDAYNTRVMSWINRRTKYRMEGPDRIYRPAYYAAAAVCSNIDDTLRKTGQKVEIADAEKLNPQIMTFERIHRDFRFAEVVILVWAGVRADDEFQARPVDITLPGPTDAIGFVPIGYSLLPVGAVYSKMGQFEWGVEELLYELSDSSLKLLDVPLSDAPYVIKYIRRLPDSRTASSQERKQK